jgi:hypothetical protein
VTVISGETVRSVDAVSAVNFFISNVAGTPLTTVSCPRCSGVHLDVAEFAIKEHVKHLCNWCGRDFWVTSPSVSNPCAYLQQGFGERLAPVRSDISLNIRQADFAGLAIWGSNPAILWTASIPEQEGIHVHALEADGALAIDDTYGSVTIDGFELDPHQVRLLMMQRALPQLMERIQSLVCGACGSAHLDDGSEAVNPTSRHICGCGEQLIQPGRIRNVVSNPIVDVLAALTVHQPDPSRWRHAA